MRRRASLVAREAERSELERRAGGTIGTRSGRLLRLAALDPVMAGVGRTMRASVSPGRSWLRRRLDVGRFLGNARTGSPEIEDVIAKYPHKRHGCANGCSRSKRSAVQG